MDETLLISLGLGQKEVNLYKAVAKAEQLTPAELAKAIGIKRTTAYGMARGLVERGLFVEDVARRPRVFMLAGPEEIQATLQAERKRSTERELILEKLSESVSRAQAERTYPVPRIKFIEEGKLENHLYSGSPVWWESMEKRREMTWWGFQDASFVERFSTWIDWQWEHTPETIDLKLLTNLSTAERGISGKYPRRNTKFWGEANNFISSTWVMGDYVVMVNTRQKPFYLIEIQSETLAHDQREVFRNLWDIVQ